MTRHIPVQMISRTENLQQAKSIGALSITQKPATKHQLSGLVEQFKPLLEHSMRKIIYLPATKSHKRYFCIVKPSFFTSGE